MRSTPSRFSAYVASVDPNIEGRPATLRPSTLGGAPLTSSPKSLLEQRYPEIVRTLTLLWGYPEMNQFFSKVASAQDPSLNLDPAAMSELMVLADVHRRICPQSPARSVQEIYGTGRWAEPWKPATQRG